MSSSATTTTAPAPSSRSGCSIRSVSAARAGSASRASMSAEFEATPSYRHRSARAGQMARIDRIPRGESGIHRRLARRDSPVGGVDAARRSGRRSGAEERQLAGMWATSTRTRCTAMAMAATMLARVQARVRRWRWRGRRLWGGRRWPGCAAWVPAVGGRRSGAREGARLSRDYRSQHDLASCRSGDAAGGPDVDAAPARTGADDVPWPREHLRHEPHHRLPARVSRTDHGRRVERRARAGALLSINHPGRETGDRCTGCGWDAPGTPWERVEAMEVINGGVIEGPTAGMPFWYARLNEGRASRRSAAATITARGPRADASDRPRRSSTRALSERRSSTASARAASTCALAASTGRRSISP